MQPKTIFYRNTKRDLNAYCGVGQHPQPLWATDLDSCRFLLSSPHKVVVRGITKETRSNLRHTKLDTSGFTLIELLVVVLIIGILATVAVPQYQLAVAKSRYATLKALTTSLYQAEQLYFMANGEYTNDLDMLSIDTPAYTRVSINSASSHFYYFSWGHCLIDTWHTECTNTKIPGGALRYGIRWNKTPHQRSCVANSTDLNSVPNKVCKTETKATAEFSTGYTAWRY